jgi:hypothetical protein
MSHAKYHVFLLALLGIATVTASSCTAGTYLDAATDSCSSCAAGTYSAMVGATETSTCTPCPSNSTGPAGAVSSSECVCLTDWSDAFLDMTVPMAEYNHATGPYMIFAADVVGDLTQVGTDWYFSIEMKAIDYTSDTLAIDGVTALNNAFIFRRSFSHLMLQWFTDTSTKWGFRLIKQGTGKFTYVAINRTSDWCHVEAWQLNGVLNLRVNEILGTPVAVTNDELDVNMALNILGYDTRKTAAISRNMRLGFNNMSAASSGFSQPCYCAAGSYINQATGDCVVHTNTSTDGVALDGNGTNTSGVKIDGNGTKTSTSGMPIEILLVIVISCAIGGLLVVTVTYLYLKKPGPVYRILDSDTRGSIVSGMKINVSDIWV